METFYIADGIETEDWSLAILDPKLKECSIQIGEQVRVNLNRAALIKLVCSMALQKDRDEVQLSCVWDGGEPCRDCFRMEFLEQYDEFCFSASTERGYSAGLTVSREKGIEFRKWLEALL